ncbi:hypothetical protein RF11_16337 [Thelohanellus kitauei]|uniref:Reverse transcriptase/retrotransposon-derived protein RNase H-like domain-containing protein n=1 Tax=Thelohanellus kitauei TaxID=669202 RepID=A0A0C2IUQ1_THEKT|nr:hypothetical protein RF11_16337 [Thelohanellus kitauei]
MARKYKTNSLEQPYVGPYEIIQINGPVYIIYIGDGKIIEKEDATKLRSSRTIKIRPEYIEFIKKRLRSFLRRGGMSFEVMKHNHENTPRTSVEYDRRFKHIYIEFRKLNYPTLVDAYPVPQKDETIDAFCGSKWFLTFDMSSRYWQVMHLKEYRNHDKNKQPGKCHFFRKEIKYLRFLLKEDGIGTEPDITETVAQFPTPKSKNSFSPFWVSIRTIENSVFECNPYYQEDFKNLKRQLWTAPILDYPDFEKKIIVDTDASGCAIGVVLSQIGEFDET